MKRKAKFFLDENKILINRTLYIKVYGKELNTLVGIPGLCDILGDVLAYKIIRKALFLPNLKVVVKLRRGIKVTIYAK